MDIAAWLNGIDSWLGSAFWFPFALLGVGLWFTIYLKFPQIRFFRHAWRVLSGRYDPPDAPGDTTRFQALATALSGTVGTGNIGGVAFALYLGGPAALFWMWMTAFLGMTTKLVEVTLSFEYRVKDDAGFMSGGPMYYMERSLKMKWLAVLFAIATVVSAFGSGNMPQSNNIAQGLAGAFGLPVQVTGGVLAVLLGLVIIGGIKRIAQVTSTLVPFMAVFYVAGAISVTLYNWENLLPSFLSVFEGAFTGSAAVGGFLGASFAYAFNRGVNRGLFSNEAGQGSSPIAHASAKGNQGASEGMVALLEPFIDTIIICTLTGMAILSSGVWHEKFQNEFQSFDTQIVDGVWSDADDAHVNELRRFLNTSSDEVRLHNGALQVVNGVLSDAPVTVVHNRSVAENVRFWVGDEPYNGQLRIEQGKPTNADVHITGKSLVHSISLTVEAFKRSWLGAYGEYVVAIGLLMFAFSTAISWSYYGDRAITYLLGVRWVTAYRVVYTFGFFLAAVVDTSLIWLVSAVTVALMTLPNLFGLVLRTKEIGNLVEDFWQQTRPK